MELNKWKERNGTKRELITYALELEKKNFLHFAWFFVECE